MIRIAPVFGAHPGLEALRRQADLEGFRFMSRLLTEWQSGSNRFERVGESLLGAFEADELAGICGLSRHPYLDHDDVGRLRHLYVRPASRRDGVASALVGRLLASATRVFRVVRLRTDTPEGLALYEKLGFVRVADATASHVKVLR